MSTVEKRIQEAFDAVTMPPGLKESTLAAIERIEGTERQIQPQPQQTDHPTAEHPSFQQVSAKTEDATRTSTTAQRHTKPSGPRRLGLALAACLLLCALGIGGFTAYAAETAQVGLEVNPAIELGVNRFDIVVSARAVNEDGQLVLDSVEVEGKTYQQALETITTSDTFLAYIGQDSFVDINVVCNDERQAGVLVRQSDESIQGLPCAGACSQVSAEERNEALEAGMGFHRYEAAQELLALDPSLNIEDCSHMSMKEIREHIAELDPDNEYAHTSGQGNGQGMGNGQSGNSEHGKGNGNNNAGHGTDFHSNSE